MPLGDERSTITIGLVCVMGVLALSLVSTPCVAIRITNCYARTIRVAVGPVTLCADVRVQPDADHRWLTVEWRYAELAGFPVLPELMPELPDSFNEPEARDGPVGSAEDDLDGDREPLKPRPLGLQNGEPERRYLRGDSYGEEPPAEGVRQGLRQGDGPVK